MKRLTSTLSRRSFISGASGALAVPLITGRLRAASTSGSLTMVAFGGSYQEALTDCVATPFTEETGIKINFVNAPDLSKIKAMQLTGNVEWDIYLDGGTVLASGSRQKFWEPLNPSIFDSGDLVVPPKDDFATYEMYAYGIAWDPKKYGPQKHPGNFAEFFDLKKFPGRRSMRPIPDGTLEIALLADGVAPDRMYPLDLDRAFKVLDRIKSVTVWPIATPQSVSLVQTGEVDFSITYANRVKATNDPGGGLPLAFSFEQNALSTGAVAVVKGAPNKEGAMKLIGFMMRPEVEARLEARAGNTPASKKAAAMLSAEDRKWRPDLTKSNNLTISSEYWADNFDAVSRRFKEWVIN
ncbi:ABC transporter substrate-binding protein [Bradyrhizobium sp. 150]|uniref:ABC transporter substrate-binding protein n=1 Tax=Bradyrhizobium sp. 150 TaxID=2782625 RepID=UPI001FFB9CAC|nr:ABC transporter substrate-binding protein [Bradyrhizobium sp. 150]MCK1676769.1 ABC transporter substrate-binding protein [Bradyrhizobium sp. 150]